MLLPLAVVCFAGVAPLVDGGTMPSDLQKIALIDNSFGRPPTANELVAYLNRHADRTQNLLCTDVNFACTQGVQSVGGIAGKLACAQPRRFRITAQVGGKSEVDLGSNDKEFWYWIAKSNPPYQFYCSYDDLHTKHVPLPFPFQPEWVMETLGMANYPVNGQYQVVFKHEIVELIQDTVSLQGQAVRKVVAFNRKNMKNGHQIRAYFIRDRSGKEICSAQIQDVQTIDGNVVPFKVEFTWPDQKLKIDMQLNKPTLNQLSPEMAQTLFSRRPLQGVQSFDLEGVAPAPDRGGKVQ